MNVYRPIVLALNALDFSLNRPRYTRYIHVDALVGFNCSDASGDEAEDRFFLSSVRDRRSLCDERNNAVSKLLADDAAQIPITETIGGQKSAVLSAPVSVSRPCRLFLVGQRSIRRQCRGQPLCRLVYKPEPLEQRTSQLLFILICWS